MLHKFGLLISTLCSMAVFTACLWRKVGSLIKY